MIRTTLYPDTLNIFNSIKELDTICEDILKKDSTYPLYNIYKDEDNTVIELAVTGFKKSNIKIYFDKEGLLTVEGTKEVSSREYIHKSLVFKDFVKKFNMSSMIVKTAKVEDGLLTITLEKDKKDISYISID
jgi:HSP20 family molecular chaperone IbpA